MPRHSQSSAQRVISSLSLALILVASLVLGFQNCAPSLPSDDQGVQASTAIYTQPTPVPSSNYPTPSGSVAPYGGTTWEGQCSSDPTSDPMAIIGSDTAGAPLVAFNNSSLGTSAIWNFSASQVYRGVVCTLGSGWKIAAVGDFNGDGQQDVIWRNTDGRTVVWYMFGASRLSGGFLPSMSASTYKLAGTGDFNGDGKADIFWLKSDGTSVIWQMNGTLSPTSITVSTSSSGLSLQGIADFDGDGKADLLWRTGNTLSIWFMNSLTTGAPVVSMGNITGQTIDANWKVMGVGDYSYDGRADIMLFNITSNAAQKVWAMNGVTILKQTEPLNTTNSSMVAVPLVVDATKDGVKDAIFTAPQSSGTGLLIWQMGTSGSNVQPLSYSFVGTVQSGYTPFSYER